MPIKLQNDAYKAQYACVSALYIFFLRQRKSFVSTRSYRFVNIRLARTEYDKLQNYKERVAISRIKLHSKFTEKPGFNDYYITELNNRQRKGMAERKRRLLHNLSGLRVPGRTVQSLLLQVPF